MAVRIRTTGRFRAAANQPLGSASIIVGNAISPNLHRYDWFPESGTFGDKKTDSLLGSVQEVRGIAWDEANRNLLCAVGTGTSTTQSCTHRSLRLTQAGLVPVSQVVVAGVANACELDVSEGVCVFTNYATSGGGIYRYSPAGIGSYIGPVNSSGATVAVAMSRATKKIAFGGAISPRITYHGYSQRLGIPPRIVWTLNGEDSPIGNANTTSSTTSALTFNADGSRLVVGYNQNFRIAVFETDRLSTEGLYLQEQVFTYPSAITGLAINPQETMLAVAGAADVTLYRWSGAIISALRGATPPGTIRCVDWSPDGKYLAVGLSITPFIQVYRVDDTGIVAACPNPTTTPGGTVNTIKFAY